MLKDTITYFNGKLSTLGYFNEVICLAERIEREGRVYPAQYNQKGQYVEINLDNNGSLCYWRKNGDVTTSEEDNSSGIGIQYRTTIPLKFVGFIKKDNFDDQYFSDNLIASIIGNLTTNNSALKIALKAKLVRLSSTKYVTDGRIVGQGEYDNINFEPQYTHAYFSIDFDLTYVSASQCFVDICVDFPSTIDIPALLGSKKFQLLTLTYGSVDGTNAVFMFDAPPIQVFNSGVLKYLGVAYTISGNTITFDASYIPFVGDLIEGFGYK